MSPYTALWLRFLGLALVLELPVVAWLAREHWRRAVVAALVGNAVTHPVMWFVLPRLVGPWPAYVLGELFAFVIEAVFLALVGRLAWRRAALASLAANLYSWGIGEYVVRVAAPALARYWWAH